MLADWSGVERQLARSQEMWESKYNKFIAELSTFVSKEISEFWHSVLSMGESTALNCKVLHKLHHSG